LDRRKKTAHFRKTRKPLKINGVQNFRIFHSGFFRAIIKAKTEIVQKITGTQKEGF